MKVFRSPSPRLVLQPTTSPKCELVGYVSSSPLAAPFPPSHLCRVWCFIQMTTNRGDWVSHGGMWRAGDRGGVGPPL